MLNKSVQSSCHSLTCALFVCGYCLSLGVAGGERCQFAHCWQPARSARPPWDMRQKQASHTHKHGLLRVRLQATYTHTNPCSAIVFLITQPFVSQSLMH